MLRTLHDACERAGIRIEYGRRMDDVETLRRQFDLVVAADGGNSTVRSRYAEHFRPRLREAAQQVRLVRHTPALSPRVADLSSDRVRRVHRAQLPVQPRAQHVPGRGGARDVAEGRTRPHERGRQPPVLRGRVPPRPGCERPADEPLALVRGQHRAQHAAGTTRTSCCSAMPCARSIFHWDPAPAWPCRMRSRSIEALAAARGDLRQAFASFEESRGAASATFQQAAARSLDWYEKVAAACISTRCASPTTTCGAQDRSPRRPRLARSALHGCVRVRSRTIVAHIRLNTPRRRHEHRPDPTICLASRSHGLHPGLRRHRAVAASTSRFAPCCPTQPAAARTTWCGMSETSSPSSGASPS